MNNYFTDLKILYFGYDLMLFLLIIPIIISIFFLTEMPVISKSVYFFFEIYNLIQNYILLCFVIFISHTRELFYMFHLSLQWQPQTGNFL